jgi:hypothetical protein
MEEIQPLPGRVDYAPMIQGVIGYVTAPRAHAGRTIKRRASRHGVPRVRKGEGYKRNF